MEKVPTIKSLNEIRSYRNENVIYRFTELFRLSEDQADDIFDSCKMWLWLCANAAVQRKRGDSEVPEKIAIDNSVLIIDEMWHNFLCFTKDYQEFCHTYFGFFIHHNPTPKPFNNKLKHLYATDMKILRDRREIQYTYIGNLLGTDIFKKWYIDYAEAFDKKKINKLRK